MTFFHSTGDAVAVQPVEDPAGLLRVDEVEVEFAGVVQGVLMASR